jgi:hypothetical protein
MKSMLPAFFVTAGVLLWFVLVASAPAPTLSFVASSCTQHRLSTTRSSKNLRRTSTFTRSTSVIRSSNNGENGRTEYSRDVRLREEAESPFRKVRYFLYFNLAGGAVSSLFISLTRIAAAASGINVELMDESVRNAIIDITGLVAVGYFWRQDSKSEESRLKRATKGAELAKLNVRASKALLLSDVDTTASSPDEVAAASLGTFTTTLASFRRQRGIEKRVVLAVGGADRIQQVLEEARQLQPELAANDLVVVPIVMPAGVAPYTSSETATVPTNIALPVNAGNNWKRLMSEEAEEAKSQGVDIESEGFCVILKKNGRVGQRTRGIFLNNLVGNVVARKEAGMDVKNI